MPNGWYQVPYVTIYEKYWNVMVSPMAGTRYVTIYEKYWDVMVSPMAGTRYTTIN